MYKVDFHTHSYASSDGGLKLENYQRALDSQLLDYIAVTDHNRIDAALEIKQQLGEKIIVGEEIMTADGEVIGLYLSEPVPAGLSLSETIRLIKDQRGLVYVPHPFESVRKGLHPGAMEVLADQIDILEVCNGRAFLQNRSAQAVVWARLNNIVGAASSDAHGFRGLGRTHTSLNEPPTKENLLSLLVTAKLITDHPTVRGLLYPKFHRLRHKLKGQA